MPISEWSPVAPQRNDRYFRWSSVFAYFFSICGMTLLSMTFLTPSWVPYDTLGPIGTFARFMSNYLSFVLKIIFYAAWSAHIIQAWLAVKICRQKGIDEIRTRWWFIQTLLCGYFSLYKLVDYNDRGYTSRVKRD